MSLEKISQAKIAEVLADSAAALRAITSERDALQEKLAGIEHRAQVEKVASAMVEKGLAPSMESALDAVEKNAAAGKFEQMAQAVDMAGPEMWSKLAQPTDERRSGEGSSDLVGYLLG